MLIVCPSCKTKFSFDEQKVGAEGVKLRCSKCSTIFRIVRKAASAPPAPVEAPQPAEAPAPARVTVVVANESPAFCSAVQKVLASEPFDVFTYNDGKVALAAIEQLRPDVVLLDVALPSLYGFEVCEAVRKNPDLSSTKLILIASIYDKTRYKRTPSSFYGADDYIEKHHIPDLLVALIYKLISGQKQVEASRGKKLPVEAEAQAAVDWPSKGELAAQNAAREELKRDDEETSAVPPPSSTVLPEDHLKAKRLARIIVSDIILYNQGKVEDGIRNGTFYELLADDIGEGRSLYARRVADDIHQATSYLEDAFEELIAKKRREFGLT
ncbi:MAG TPA: response regulator [Geobacteraceae bacterium]|nr:response regulator [Geobacteraceae bacterium]